MKNFARDASRLKRKIICAICVICGWFFRLPSALVRGYIAIHGTHLDQAGRSRAFELDHECLWSALGRARRDLRTRGGASRRDRFQVLQSGGARRRPTISRTRVSSILRRLRASLRRAARRVIASIVGTSEEEFVAVAKRLDRAGVAILELNLADDYVLNSIAPFASLERTQGAHRASARRDRMRARGEASAGDGILGARYRGFAQVDARGDRGMPERSAQGPRGRYRDRDRQRSPSARSRTRTRSSARATALLDIVAVGGINTGRDAYLAHLTGAKAVQVGSALIKEGAGALGRIDRELDAILAQNGKRSVAEIVGPAQIPVAAPSAHARRVLAPFPAPMVRCAV